MPQGAGQHSADVSDECLLVCFTFMRFYTIMKCIVIIIIIIFLYFLFIHATTNNKKKIHIIIRRQKKYYRKITHNQPTALRIQYKAAFPEQ